MLHDVCKWDFRCCESLLHCGCGCGPFLLSSRHRRHWLLPCCTAVTIVEISSAGVATFQRNFLSLTFDEFYYTHVPIVHYICVFLNLQEFPQKIWRVYSKLSQFAYLFGSELLDFEGMLVWQEGMDFLWWTNIQHRYPSWRHQWSLQQPGGMKFHLWWTARKAVPLSLWMANRLVKILAIGMWCDSLKFDNMSTVDCSTFQRFGNMERAA